MNLLLSWVATWVSSYSLTAFLCTALIDCVRRLTGKSLRDELAVHIAGVRGANQPASSTTMSRRGIFDPSMHREPVPGCTVGYAAAYLVLWLATVSSSASTPVIAFLIKALAAIAAAFPLLSPIPFKVLLAGRLIQTDKFRFDSYCDGNAEANAKLDTYRAKMSKLKVLNRFSLAELLHLESRATPGVKAYDTEYSTADNTSLKMRVYKPQGEHDGRRTCIVWYHGGGWVLGTYESIDGHGYRLAGRLNCVVISVQYRLAPKFKFPTAATDAMDAYRHIRAKASSLAIDPARIFVAGDSAGGNLALNVCQQSHSQGVPMPCGQLLVYPCAMARRVFPSNVDYASDRTQLLSLRTMDWFIRCYQRTDADQDHRLLSPLLADPTIFPPTWVMAAEFDVLKDQDIDLALRLAQAGVPCELMAVENVPHGFMSSRLLFPQEQERCYGSMIKFVLQHTVAPFKLPAATATATATATAAPH